MTAGPALARLGAWAAGLAAPDLPEAVVHAATRSILDTVGVGLAGACRPVTRAVIDTIAAEVAPGRSTVLGTSLRLRPLGAALINGTACHALDFDDTCYDGIVHASCVILPAVLACAEEQGAPGGDLLAGFVAGSEITYVLGRALPGIFWQGWWTTSLLGAVGAAAGAARTLGLDAGRTAHAMAIASCFTFGLRTLLGTDATAIGAGYAAEAGVRAALFAAKGLRGPVATFEGDLGIAQMFNRGAVDATAFDTLGHDYALARDAIAFKAYPACSGTQAAVQAVGELIAEQGLSAAAVAHVHCRVTPLVAENLRYPRPASLTEAQFSLPFAIGCQLRFGAFGPRELADGVLDDAGLEAQMAKVEMLRDDGLVGSADRERWPEAAEVTMTLADGRTLRRFVGAARGMPDVPISDADLDRKFIACADEALGRDDGIGLLQRLRDLERVSQVRDLFAGAVL